MKNYMLVAALCLLTGASVLAQTNVTNGFKKTPKGLWYKIVVDAKKPKASIGYISKMNAVYATQRDSVLFSTFEQGMGPVQFTLTAPTFNGDPMEGFTLLGEGDSAIFLMPVDSAFKTQELPPFAKKGEFIKIKVSILSVLSKEDFDKQKAQEAQMQTQMEIK